MLISVIMSVYNAESTLSNAIKSILNQSMTDFEFIIIDDGSSDKSLEIIYNYQIKDKRIIILKNKVNIGLTKTLNKAIQVASGKYIARQDADDISLSNRLEKQLNFLDNNEDYVFCGTNGFRKQTNEELLKFFDYHDIKKNLILKNCFVHPSIMIRNEAFKKYGFYDESYRFAQDYELWCRLIYKYNLKAKNLKEKLITMYIPSESLLEKNHHKLFYQRLNGIKIKLKYYNKSPRKIMCLILIIRAFLEIFILFFLNMYSKISLKL